MLWTRILLLTTLAFASRQLLQQGYSYDKSPLGADVYHKETGERQYHTVAYFPDIDEQVNHMKNTLEKGKLDEKSNLRGGEKSGKTTITCDWGTGPDYFRFAPQFLGKVFTTSTEAINVKTHCF